MEERAVFDQLARRRPSAGWRGQEERWDVQTQQLPDNQAGPDRDGAEPKRGEAHAEDHAPPGRQGKAVAHEGASVARPCARSVLVTSAPMSSRNSRNNANAVGCVRSRGCGIA